MFYMVRESDGKVHIKSNFNNIQFFEDEENKMIAFPPKVGCVAILYESWLDIWQTTVITHVQKISETEYEFDTKTNTYIIIKDWNNNKIN